MNQPAESIKTSDIFGMTRIMSREKLLSFLMVPNVEIAESNSSRVIHGFDTTVCCMSSSCANLIFKAHFNPIEISPFIESNPNRNTERVSGKDSINFMKEFSNLIAGELRNAFEVRGQSSGLSPVLHTRGFDEIFFVPPDNVTRFEDKWILKIGFQAIHCSCALEVSDRSLFNALDFSTSDESEPLRKVT